MRIADRIASEIMDMLEDNKQLKVKKDDYLDTECIIADLIKQEINKWLGYDTDLTTFETDEKLLVDDKNEEM